jgi:hypothetical protein
MRKTLVALAAVAILANSAAQPAYAQRATATTPYGYASGCYYYGPGPPFVVAGPCACYWQQQRFWDGYVWRFRRVRVCGTP